MRNYLVTALGAMSLAVALAACGGTEATPTPTRGAIATPTPTATPEAEVPELTATAIIQNFSHQDLTVKVGTAVTWTNKDNLAHTTTSGTPGAQTDLWDSGAMRVGGTFTRTFLEPGTYPFFCKFHPADMQATITVTNGDGASAGAASSQTQTGAVPTAGEDTSTTAYSY